jgi:acyl-CoA synthetase (AMP-forming)/AMP-acid ligase II
MAGLTAPGAEFALTPASHHGVPVETFAGAAPSLAEAFALVPPDSSRDALVFRDERTSFAGLVDTTTRIAAALRTRFGVARGDRVSIAMRNYPEWVLAYWAAALLGAVVVPLNAWSTGPELKGYLDRARPRVLFVDAERLERLAAVYGERVDGTEVVRVRAAARGLTSVPIDELVNHDAALPPLTPPTGEDVATILYTSGTTGAPKGVIGTHLNHVTALRGIQLRAAARAAAGGTDGPEPRALVTFPFFHVAGLAMMSACVVTGKPMVLMYKWDPAEALRLVESERVTELYGPPVVVRDLVAAAEGSGRDLSSLRLFGSGGSVTATAQVERVRRVFGSRVHLSNGYGLTETTGTVVTQAGQEMFDHPEALGRPVPGIRVRVVDPDGRPLPAGVEGEIEVMGAVVSPGYDGDPEATARAFAGGWFRTGDTGTVDPEGRVILRGRLKDVVIRGGENIACAEVESALDAHPDVEESAVLGRPDPVMGEEVTAVVRARDGAVLDLDALTEHLRARLAGYKVPSEIIVVSSPLPRSATGKLVKSALARHVGGRLG